MKKLNKYKYIYLFIVILSLIGFISGYCYYTIQEKSTKEEIIERINIKEEITATTNNIPKRLKESFICFISSITIIPEVSNIFKIYYEPFQTGFIFNVLKYHGTYFSFIYTLIYYLIPLLFKLILIRITMTITFNIIKYILKREHKAKKYIKVLIKKYIVITLILLFYEFVVFIFNANINSYLMTILRK